MTNNKATLLKDSLMTFYKSKDNISKFVDVIEKKTEYSLRIIEWFCTNYSKKYDVSYKINKNTVFNVYFSYKNQLNSFQKKQFDPFKRKHDGYEKFPLKYGDNKVILTTVAQLNFFKWCICNNIFQYIQKHLNDIKNDMPKINNKSNKINTKHITISATRTCIKRYTKVRLDFK